MYTIYISLRKKATGARAIIKVSGSSAPVVSRWLKPAKRTFLEVASMVVT